jgi:hypothetical protein
MRRGFAVFAAGLVIGVSAAACARTDDAGTAPPVLTEPATTAAPTTTSANPDKKTRLDHGTTSPTGPRPSIAGVDAPALATLAPADQHDEWVEVIDDTGSITLEVPEAWEVDTRTRLVDERDVPAVYAAADEARYAEGFGVPGLAVLRYPETLAERGAAWALDRMDTRDRVEELCSGETTDIVVSRGWLTGFGDVTAGCGADDAVVVHLALDTSSGPTSDLTVVQAQLLTTADLQVLDRALTDLEAAARDADGDRGPSTTSDEETTTTQAAGGEARAIQLVEARLAACGFESHDARATAGWVTEVGNSHEPGQWMVAVGLSKLGQDYGRTEYAVNVDQGVVYSEGAVAAQLCP